MRFAFFEAEDILTMATDPSSLTLNDLLGILKGAFSPKTVIIIAVVVVILAGLIVLINHKGKGAFGIGYLGAGALLSGSILYGLSQVLKLIPDLLSISPAYKTVIKAMSEEALGDFVSTSLIITAAGAVLIVAAIVIRIIRSKNCSKKLDNSDTLLTQESVIV